MITTTGKQNLLRIVAGLPGTAVNQMVLGIGNTVAAVTDTRLDYEVLRLPIATATPDFVNNTVVYKATIPAEFAGDIYEVGLVAGFDAPISQVTAFNEDAGFWSAGAASALNSRVMGSTLLLNPGASATQTANGALTIDWTEMEDVVVSYFVGSNVSAASVRFLTDGSNYYSSPALSVTAGYRIVRIPKASFTATGTPSAINSVSVIGTATGGGTAALYFDSLAWTRRGTPTSELMQRRVLAANVNKTAGLAQDFETTLGLT